MTRMNPDAIVQIVTSALGIVAAVAPGVLAAAMGQRTDEEAIAAASARVRGIRRSPALTAIDAERVPLTAIPLEAARLVDLSPPQLLASPRLNLRHVIRGGPLTDDDAPALPDDDEDGA